MIQDAKNTEMQQKNWRSEAKSVDCFRHVPLSDTGICAVVDRFCLNGQKTRKKGKKAKRQKGPWRLGRSSGSFGAQRFVSRIMGKRIWLDLSKRRGMHEGSKRSCLGLGRMIRVWPDPLTGTNAAGYLWILWLWRTRVGMDFFGKMSGKLGS